MGNVGRCRHRQRFALRSVAADVLRHARLTQADTCHLLVERRPPERAEKRMRSSVTAHRQHGLDRVSHRRRVTDGQATIRLGFNAIVVLDRQQGVETEHAAIDPTQHEPGQPELVQTG